MYDMSVDEIIADVMNAGRDLIVEDAVDEYLLAEKDILTEATIRSLPAFITSAIISSTDISYIYSTSLMHWN